METTIYATAIPTVQPALDRGARLGRYVVLELLGVGGMGEVYTASIPSSIARSRSKCCTRAEASTRQSSVYDVGSSDGRIPLCQRDVRHLSPRII